MAKKMYFGQIALLTLLVFVAQFSKAQFLISTTDTNFYDIVNHYGSSFQSLAPIDTTEKEDQEESDGLYSKYSEWYSHWAPRLYPTGSFKVAADAYNSFFNSIGNSSSRTTSAVSTASSTAPTANWQEIGPYTSDGGVGEMTRIAFHPNFGSTTATNNTQTIYAASQGGGVWISTDAGANWNNLNTDHEFAFLCVRALSVDPHVNTSGYNNIFAGTGDGYSVLSNGIYRSRDGGATWGVNSFPINTGLPSMSSMVAIKQFAINPIVSGEIFAATSKGLYHTTNSDATPEVSVQWNPLAMPAPVLGSGCSVMTNPSATDPYIQNVVLNPANTISSQTVYASGYDIYTASNNGSGWGAFTSMTGGSTGLDLSNGINCDGSTILSINIAVTPAATTGGVNNKVYASIYSTFYACSSTQPTTPCSSACSACKWIDRYTFWYFDGTTWHQGDNTNQLQVYAGASQNVQCISVSPIDEHDIYYGAEQIFNSHSTISPQGIGYVFWNMTGYNTLIHADVHDMQFSPNENPPILYVATDGGIFKRTNAAANTWSKISNGLAVSRITSIGVSATDDALMLLGKFDEGIYSYDDTKPNGSKWTPYLTNTDGMRCKISYDNVDWFGTSPKAGYYGSSTIGVIHYKFNSTTRTLSQSATISKLPNFWDSEWNAPYAIDETNKNIYIGYTDMQKSTYQGQNKIVSSGIMANAPWSSSNGTCGPLEYIALSPTNTNYIYATSDNIYSPSASCPAGTSSRLFLSTTGGGTSAGSWTEIPTPINGFITSIVVHPLNPNKIWITYSGYNTPSSKVYMYDGTTWTDYDNPSLLNRLPFLPVNCMIYYEGTNDALFVGTDVGVYYIDNSLFSSGQGWQQYNTGLPNAVVTELGINYSENNIKVATYGRGVWKSDLPCPSIYDDLTETSNYSTDTYIWVADDIASTSIDAPPYNVTYHAGNQVDLKPGFTASASNTSIFHAFISTCDMSAQRQSGRGRFIKASAITKNTQNTNIDKMDRMLASAQSIDISPNPNQGTFMLRINDNIEQEVYTVTVMDISGRLITEIQNLESKIISIDLSGLPDGLYFVKVYSKNWQAVKKVIIQN